MSDAVGGIPEGQLFAQVESVWAVKDYPPYRSCVRLIGVDRSAFDSESYNSESGCQTYVIDLDWRDVGTHLDWKKGYPWFDPGPFISNRASPNRQANWFKIDFALAPDFANSYAYPAFEAADPTYIHIRAVSRVPGSDVQPLALSTSPAHLPSSAEGTPCKLTAFHVGQGMCSVFHASDRGYILDAGAGTPVKRKQYLAGAHDDGMPFVNELRHVVSALSEASAILSHPDSDHWRLLDWDAALLAKMQSVFLPAGEPALAFAAPALKPKVVGIGDQVFNLTSRNWLDVRRSRPAISDKNGECLVTAVHCGQRVALLPGDYVYERMGTDSNVAIVQMAQQRFDAVVVPHHGDEASAAQVVAPRQPLESRAFFSAGNHSGYGHPTPASVAGHRRRDFLVIEDHLCRDVVGRHLLP
jgi:beta-lactamase superfamily II metal-dependent hydrolase